MKNYKWFLFDADETLFCFDSFSGLKRMFSDYGINFTQENFKEFQNGNKKLWASYQNGNITAQQLQQQRFNHWSNQLQVQPEILNSNFLTAMAEISAPIEGAVTLLNTLKGKAKLGIITNGFSELQQVRLERTGLKHHFEFVVISEKVGVAKPHPAIFDHAIDLMGNPPRDQILMVGDTLESDILGGINSGLDTCWLNAANKPCVEGIKPHFEVKSLHELNSLLNKSFVTI